MNTYTSVFADPTNKRWRFLRKLIFYVACVGSILAVILLGSVLIQPFLYRPELTINAHYPLHRRFEGLPKRHFVSANEHLFQEDRKRLFRAEQQKSNVAHSTPGTRMPFSVAAFYVTWDDASFTSLQQNIKLIDRLYPQWINLISEKGDLQSLVDEPASNFLKEHKDLPVVPLVTNFDFKKEKWRAKEIAASLRSPTARTKMIWTLLDFVQHGGYRGVMVDFEQILPAAQPGYRQFITDLAILFHQNNFELDIAVPFNDPAINYAGLAKIADHLCLMAYDEHADGTDPGPISSISWFDQVLKRRVAQIRPEKMIICLGSYGYDWQKKTKHAHALTFEESMVLAQESDAEIDFNDASLNATFDYWDDRRHAHTVWYLDAPSFFNQIQVAENYQPLGIALWRLGAEDPGDWKVVGTSDRESLKRELSILHYGYDLNYKGDGEMISVQQTPQTGSRSIEWDRDTPLIADEVIKKFPFPYTLNRYGAREKMVSLTFDDGPDTLYTPRILDILKNANVKATFFVIGINAEVNRQLIRREYQEGHEVGNHTFTHPNIAQIPISQLELELNTTQRLLESILSRSSVLFRPPYNVDAEPNIPEEAAPLAVSSRLGYIAVGSKIDPADYLQPGVQLIIDRTIADLDKGNVILLHDSGGRREQTVACLPRLIEAIREQGYEIVPLSTLLHKTRDEVMPPLSPRERYVVWADSLSFMLGQFMIYFLRWGLVIGVLFGLARFVFYAFMAIVERWQRPTHSPPYEGPVDIVIPAYNEARVIIYTVRSLLRSSKENIHIIVVNDGSTDDTSHVLRSAFPNEKRLCVIDRPNQGKWAALNHGMEQATNEIVVTLDADTLFEPHSIEELIRPFADPSIAASAGNAKVGNRINILTRWQALEYITTQNLDRRANALLNCITVVPGAVGAWRRSIVRSVGGFKPDTLAEDAELTVRLLKDKHKVVYADQALAWTEAPETTQDLFRQRFRWTFGTLQTAWKYRNLLFKRGSGTLGFIVLPNVFLFQVVFPFISPLMDAAILFSGAFFLLQWSYHPTDFNGEEFQHTLFYYALFLALDLFASLIAFLLEPKREDWSLLLWLPWQRFYYRQLMYIIAIRSVLVAMKGIPVGWGHITRNATHIEGFEPLATSEDSALDIHKKISHWENKAS